MFIPQSFRFRRWAERLLFVLIFVITAASLWLYGIAHSALPKLDGTLRALGLAQKVTVTRDAQGVPTLDAASLPDLFYAQGYVTAQDRLWQMDMMRRFALGHLAEIIGLDGLPHDKQQRILGIPQVARRAAEALSAEDRTYFEAYARGVNACMEHSRAHLPVEFRLMHYSPAPWTVEDSFAVGAELAQELNHGRYRQALLREQFQAALGTTLTADLFVNSSRHDHPPELEMQSIPADVRPTVNPGGDPGDEDDEMDGDPEPVARNLGPVVSAQANLGPVILSGAKDPHTAADTTNPDSFVAGMSPSDNPDQDLAPGSNNWVVSGDHTVSGKPLLSNDMHLTHQMPNLWYEAHLHSGDFDVVGVTLPGMPFVIVGHNRRIAWGFTNVEPTVQDLYIETVSANGQYQTPQGWQALEHRREIIHVHGAADVTVDVAITRHGPIITDLIPGETRKLALRWTLYDSFTDPFRQLNAAQNWAEFRKAVSLLHSPGQNIMYADVDGHIGYQATGQYPIRKAGDGGLPVPGNDDAHEWTGWVPFDKLPSVFDPPSGVLATANGRITPDKYPFAISTMWDAPWRTDRIYRVLTSGKRLAAPDMLALETDVESAFDHACAERFVQALDKAPKLSSRAQKARELLRDWDGRLSADSAAATVEIHTRQQLTRLLLEPQLQAHAGNAGQLTWKSYHWGMSSIWLENVLTEQPKRWLPAGSSDFDEVVVAAVEATVGEPEAPSDLANWTWGKASPLEIRHLVLGKLPLIGRWTAPGLHEQSGGSFTVKQVGRSFGPSERYTADLGNLDRTTLNTVTGQSGDVLSAYYSDQWDAWYLGRTFVLPFAPQAIQGSAKHILELVPER